MAHQSICYPGARMNQNVCKLWVAIFKQDLQKCYLKEKLASSNNDNSKKEKKTISMRGVTIAI